VRVRLPNGVRDTEALPIRTRLGEGKRPQRKRAEEGEASTKPHIGGRTVVLAIFRVPAVVTIFCRFVIAREAGSGRRMGGRRG
jgi:hypothetical protein